MFIEELAEVYLMLSIERLKSIRDLQKGILRRQNRFKRILSIYTKLYEMANENDSLVISNEDDCGEDDEKQQQQQQQQIQRERFEEYHALLQTIISNHLKDVGDMKQQLQHQASLETRNKKSLNDMRHNLNATQYDLSAVFRREGKIAKTLQASAIPNNARYAGFMENVLNGLKDPSDQIDYEGYSTYCQVKWTLESEDMTYFNLSHSMFDSAMEYNELCDEEFDHVDEIILSSLGIEKKTEDVGEGEDKNLENVVSNEENNIISSNEEYQTESGSGCENMYNIYGFDGFGQFGDAPDYEENELSNSDQISDTDNLELDAELLSDTKPISIWDSLDSQRRTRSISKDIVIDQTWDIQLSDSRRNTGTSIYPNIKTLKGTEKAVESVDDAVEYVIDDIDFNDDNFENSGACNFLTVGGDEPVVRRNSKNRDKQTVENRFSAYLRESTSTTTEEDGGELDDNVGELDFDIFAGAVEMDRVTSSSHSEEMVFDENHYQQQEEEQHIKRSSHVLVKKNKKDSLKRFPSSGSNTSSSSSEITANAHVTATRRFPSISSISSTGSKDSNGRKSGKRRINARRGKLIGNSDKDLFFLPPEDFDDDLVNNNKNDNKINSDNNNNSSSSSSSSSSQNSNSGHRKLHRLAGHQTTNFNNVKIEMQNTTPQSKEHRITNVQNIMVDGNLFKVGDLTPYSLERLSIKNRPRKLSIIRHRNK